MKHGPTINCTCRYCGKQWTFQAKSKADAKRMTGPAVCQADECQSKNRADLEAMYHGVRWVDLYGAEAAK